MKLCCAIWKYSSAVLIGRSAHHILELPLRNPVHVINMSRFKIMLRCPKPVDVAPELRRIGSVSHHATNERYLQKTL